MSFLDAENILKKYCVNKKIAVAVSGGSDSMALLNFVLRSNSIDSTKLFVVNVNHKIRGKTSDDDSAFVKAKCDQLGLRLTAISVDVPLLQSASGRSVELEAREARRELFTELVSSGVADMVLLAHHALDNAETILMRALRGTGISGLAGMKIYSSNAKILRPFLTTTKQEIMEYIKENNLEYVDDESNFDEEYDRNFIRLKLMPLIKTRWQGAENALNRLGNLASQATEIIDSVVDENNFIVCKGVIKIKIDALKNDALSAEYILSAVKKLGIVSDIYSKNIDEALGLLNLQNGARVCLGQGYTAIREYEYIVIGKFANKEKLSNCINISVGNNFDSQTSDGKNILDSQNSDGENIFDGQSINIKRVSDDVALGVISRIKGGDKSSLVVDASKLGQNACIRYRREGDIFESYGSGEKKLKEYLINKKIPARMRDKIPLICYNNKVLVICGIEIAKSVSYTANCGEPIVITYSTDNLLKN